MITLQQFLWYGCTLFRRLSFGHIGSKSYMGKPIFLFGEKGVFIENNVRILPGSRFETHRGGEIHINDNTFIGQNFHCIAGSKLIIGKDCTIGGNVLITDLNHGYSEIGKHILDQTPVIKETSIGDNSFIGSGAVIQAGTKLGKQCIVGANAVVRGTFPDYCVIVGVPARKIREYNPKSGVWERV